MNLDWLKARLDTKIVGLFLIGILLGSFGMGFVDTKRPAPLFSSADSGNGMVTECESLVTELEEFTRDVNEQSRPVPEATYQGWLDQWNEYTLQANACINNICVPLATTWNHAYDEWESAYREYEDLYDDLIAIYDQMESLYEDIDALSEQVDAAYANYERYYNKIWGSIGTRPNLQAKPAIGDKASKAKSTDSKSASQVAQVAPTPTPDPEPPGWPTEEELQELQRLLDIVNDLSDQLEVLSDEYDELESRYDSLEVEVDNASDYSDWAQEQSNAAEAAYNDRHCPEAMDYQYTQLDPNTDPGSYGSSGGAGTGSNGHRTSTKAIINTQAY